MRKEKLRLDGEQEVKTIKVMMKVYCKGKQHKREGKELCEHCQELLDYAMMRMERCPRKEEKTFCNTCPIHCYKPVHRAEIKEVMKYSGPRMLIYHPIIALKHMISTVLTKPKAPH